MSSINRNIDALNSAIAEAKATLRDMHECDGAVADLVSEALAEPWTYTTTSKAHVIEMQLTGRVIEVKRVWSWRLFSMVYELTIRL